MKQHLNLYSLKDCFDYPDNQNCILLSSEPRSIYGFHLFLFVAAEAVTECQGDGAYILEQLHPALLSLFVDMGERFLAI